jgi:fucose permease
MLGLLVVGLAIAPMFPLAISLGLRHSPSKPMPVVARMGVTGAFAILIAPHTLGELADRLSLFAALGTIPVLLLIAAAALRLDDRRELHQAPAVCSHSACARLSSPASTAS